METRVAGGSATLAPSLYEASVQGQRPDYVALAASTRTEVCVVGGGFAGLHTALSLVEAGRRVVLLEAGRIGCGASGRNGGQVIPEFACGRDTLVAALGEERGAACWALARQGGHGLRERIARYAIDCDYAAGHLEVAVSARRFARLRDSAATLAAQGETRQLIGPQEIGLWVGSPLYHGGLFDPEGGHLNPVKLALGLARALQAHGAGVHERTPVRAWRTQAGGITVECADGAQVDCQQLVLAANVGVTGIAGPGMPRLARRILPVGTWLIATAPLEAALADQLLPSRAAVSDNRMVMDYFRLSSDRRMIFGGGCSYLGAATPPGFAEQLQQRMIQVFPALAEIALDYAWGGVLDISMNRAPDLGYLDAQQRVLYAQGFSGSGLVATYAAAQALAAALGGERERLELFRAVPHSAFPGGALLRAPITALGMFYHRMLDLF